MEEKKNKSTNGGAKWKEVVIGGVAGISLGAASAVLMGSALAKDETATSESPTEEPQQEDVPQEEALGTGLAEMATSVTDDMSFDEAFAAARAEVGPGGVFEWHGGLYGTYYATEWNEMTDAEREEFTNSVPWHHPEYHTNHHHVNNDDDNEDMDVAYTAPNDEDDDENDDDDAQLDDNIGDDDLDDAEIEILGVEHANLDGEHDSIIGAASIDGQAVYFVDIDGTDDEFDVMMADLNGNATIDDDEIFDISDEHISVSSFEALAGANEEGYEENLDEMYANNDTLPDYVNDVDPGNLE